jgi:SAM-dependent methyltransferase
MESGIHKDKNWWENYFSKDGGWEKNGGPTQTRLFAQKFTEIIKNEPTESFSILGAGCALGGALEHFAKVYPNACLSGIDFSEKAIASCVESFGKSVNFKAGDLDEVEGFYDLIYCSNTLEHFADFEEKARRLASHCKKLCVLVPYKEFDAMGNSLKPNPNDHHQHTFEQDSFDFLLSEKLALTVNTEVFSCVGAWGWTKKQKVEQTIKNVGRYLRKRPKRLPPRQILYDILVSE